VVPNGDQCTSAAIREYLSACLPSYMIPAMICLCESLPLSPNGKVDRHALFFYASFVSATLVSWEWTLASFVPTEDTR